MAHGSDGTDSWFDGWLAASSPVPASPIDTVEIDYWRRRAQVWAHVGAPWRPDPAALAVYQAAVDAIPAPRVLILGMTPELAGLRFPAGSRLVFVDRCAEMVAALTTPGVDRVALTADWRALPVRDATFDLVLGDGVGSVVPGPDTFREVLRELRRVSRPTARLVTRLFLCDDTPRATLVAAAPDGEHRRYALVAALSRGGGGVSRAEVVAVALADGMPLTPDLAAWQGEAARLHFYDRAALDALYRPHWCPVAPPAPGLTPMYTCVAGG